MLSETLSFVREVTSAEAISGVRVIRSLWAGYGTIARVGLVGGEVPEVVVKEVRPAPSSRESAVSDARKQRSYAVEAAFYGSYAPTLGERVRVPRLLGHREWPSGQASGARVLVLEDLARSGFVEPPTTAGILAWLARFHASTLGVAPTGLWDTGTYWHLATRQEELGRMRNARLRAKAAQLDAELSSARYVALVHGDAKPSNFLGSRSQAVAAVDFQYVGAGVGVKDVAYLLDGEPERDESAHLEGYLEALVAAVGPRGPDVAREWRALYPLAKDDFRRFLDGWQR